jgi:hypothetical protein
MKFEEQELEVQLKKIIGSDLFSRSGVSITLLSLLFYSTIEGRKLKETTIGSEIFGQRYDPVKNDTKVRVYIHNLRKKLAAYYETTGRTDKIIFEIEKGEYQVLFRSPETKRNWFGVYKLAVAVLLLLAAVGVFMFSQKKNADRFWSGFFSGKLPTTILIGDHFTIESIVPTGGQGVFRDFSINSVQDYSQHLQQHPEQASQMVPNRYPYITKMGPYCTKLLSGIFNERKIPFELMLNSEWDKAKINSENLVYVGQFKTLGFLRNLFADHFPQYEIVGAQIIRTNPQSEVENHYNSYSANQIVDYTIVSRMRGPNGNDIAMFMSDNDIGVIRLVEYFTNQDSLEVFYNRHPGLASDFAALFKVSGWERTSYSVELVHLDSN